MALSWTSKRQLGLFLMFLGVVLVVAVSLWFFLTQPTCFDGERNQGEENIDCGGPCSPCIGVTKDLITVWTKFFKLRDGKYDAAALVENPNLFLGLTTLKYRFKLYDENNILIAVRAGETFINPGEKYVIFESAIDTGFRVPKRAFIEFTSVSNWKRVEDERPKLVVSKKVFTNEPFPRLTMEVSNSSFFSVRNIYAAVLLLDKDKGVKGVSTTKIDFIEGEGTRQVVFTWPDSFFEEPESSEIFLRPDIMF